MLVSNPGFPLTVGGLSMPANVKILKTACSANQISNFYDMSKGVAGGTIYKVPVGLTFYALAFIFDQIGAGAASVSAYLEYADNNLGGVNFAGGTLTNAVGMVTGVANANIADAVSAATVGSYTRSGPQGGSAPAGKYLYGNFVVFGQLTLFGYEA